MAAYFEAVVLAGAQPKLASNWVIGDVLKWLNAVKGSTFDAFVKLLPASNLAALLMRIEDNTISNMAGKTVFIELVYAPQMMLKTPLEHVDDIIKLKDLKQLNDSSALEKIIDDVLAANAKNVAEFKAGNAKAFNALVGQAMKETQGKANPAQVNELLKKKLG